MSSGARTRHTHALVVHRALLAVLVSAVAVGTGEAHSKRYDWALEHNTHISSHICKTHTPGANIETRLLAILVTVTGLTPYLRYLALIMNSNSAELSNSYLASRSSPRYTFVMSDVYSSLCVSGRLMWSCVTDSCMHRRYGNHNSSHSLRSLACCTVAARWDLNTSESQRLLSQITIRSNW